MVGSSSDGGPASSAGVPTPLPGAVGAYQPIDVIGRGAYSVVYRACDSRTGRKVAIKRCSNTPSQEMGADGQVETIDDGVDVTTIREIAIMRSAIHPNVVPVLDVVMAPGHFDIVLELMPFHLRHIIDSAPGRLEVTSVASFTVQILRGLEYLHDDRFVMHRDLKPQNILIDEKGTAKLTDFGLARLDQAMPWRAPHSSALPSGDDMAEEPSRRLDYTARVTTLWYRPPEMLLGASRYDTSCDCWGVGAIISEMVSGKVLFPGRTEVDQIMRIFRALGTPTSQTFASLHDMPDWTDDFPRWAGQSAEQLLSAYGCSYWSSDHYSRVADLLSGLLTLDPSARLCAADAIEHPFLTEVLGASCSPKFVHHGAAAPATAADALLSTDGERMATTPLTPMQQRRGGPSVGEWDSETIASMAETMAGAN